MSKRGKNISRKDKGPNIQVSIVVVQFNNPQLTERCVESLVEHCSLPNEIILVDNNSSDPKARNLGKKWRNVRFIQNRVNEGFSKGNNTGAASARGDIVLFLNNDTVAEQDFITPIKKLFDDNPDIGIVGPRLLNADHTLQLSSGRHPSIVNEIKDKILYRSYEKGIALAVRSAKRSHSATREVKWVTGAAFFIRRSLFKKLGGFDEEFFMFFEDKDLCSRAISLGAKVVLAPTVSVVHLRGASANSSTEHAYRMSQMRYYQKHRNLLEQALLKSYLLLTGKSPHA